MFFSFSDHDREAKALLSTKFDLFQRVSTKFSLFQACGHAKQNLFVEIYVLNFNPGPRFFGNTSTCSCTL